MCVCVWSCVCININTSSKKDVSAKRVYLNFNYVWTLKAKKKSTLKDFRAVLNRFLHCRTLNYQNCGLFNKGLTVILHMCDLHGPLHPLGIPGHLVESLRPEGSIFFCSLFQIGNVLLSLARHFERIFCVIRIRNFVFDVGRNNE